MKRKKERGDRRCQTLWRQAEKANKDEELPIPYLPIYSSKWSTIS